MLDLLEHVKGYYDGTLSFRRSCAHGMCGSDALRINGLNRLACKALVQDVKSEKITVEPLLGLRVIKDLIVDMEPFFENYRSVMPYFVNDEPAPKQERRQSPEERERFDDTTKCILCASCTTSCPSFWANENYVGPAAIVNAHRFIFDSRDRMAAERLKILKRSVGRLPLSYHLQLHRCLPARDSGHQSDWRGKERHRNPQIGVRYGNQTFWTHRALEHGGDFWRRGILGALAG